MGVDGHAASRAAAKPSAARRGASARGHASEAIVNDLARRSSLRKRVRANVAPRRCPDCAEATARTNFAAASVTAVSTVLGTSAGNCRARRVAATGAWQRTQRAQREFSRAQRAQREAEPEPNSDPSPTRTEPNSHRTQLRPEPNSDPSPTRTEPNSDPNPTPTRARTRTTRPDSGPSRPQAAHPPSNTSSNRRGSFT